MNDRLPKLKTVKNDDERFSEEERKKLLIEFSKRFIDSFPGMNRAEIARRLKTTDTGVKLYAEGDRFPSVELLLQYSRVTGISVHWLLTGKGNKRIENQNWFTHEEEMEINDVLPGEDFRNKVRKLVFAGINFLKLLK